MMLARVWARLSAAWAGCPDPGWDWGGWDWGGWDWGGWDWGGWDWGGRDWGGWDWGGRDWVGRDWFGWDEADTGWEETVGLAGAGAGGFGPTRSPPVPVGPFAAAGTGRGPAAESDPAAIDLAVA